MRYRKSLARALRRGLCLALAVLMATSPSAAVLAQTNAAQQAVRQRVEGLGQPAPPSEQPTPPSPAPAGQSAPAPEGGIDMSYVSPGAVAVVVIRPAQLLSSPLTAMMPREVATAAGLKFLGFDPADVDEVVAFTEMPGPAGFSYGVTIKFNKPFKASAIPPERRAHAQLSELNGKKYLQSQNPMLFSFYGPNSQTLVLAPDETLRQMVQAQGQSLSGPLYDRVRQNPAGSDLYLAVDIAAVRPMAGMYLGMMKAQVPPDVQPFFDLPNLLAAAELTVNLTADGPTSLVAHANDDAAAEQVMTLLNDASEKYKSNLKAQLAEQASSEDPVERAWAAYAERVSNNWMSPVMPVRDGSKLTIFHSDGLDESQKRMVVAGLGIAAGMLLPALTSARQAAQRNVATNNLKQIMVAFMNHHDVKGALPAHANYSEDGKPLLSWRVHILPFIEQNELYQQFHLDEPWDSEHNKALIAQMPDVFKTPGLSLEPGKTNILAVVGEGAVMDGTAKGISFQHITDGTSKTIVVVEADPAQAVEWTKPDDLEFNPDDPKAGLGNVRPGGWNAAFCDASIQFVAEAVDPELLKTFFTRAGQEVNDRQLLSAPAAAVPDGVLLPQ
jgi:hypothetical protein